MENQTTNDFFNHPACIKMRQFQQKAHSESVKRGMRVAKVQKQQTLKFLGKGLIGQDRKYDIRNLFAYHISPIQTRMLTEALKRGMKDMRQIDLSFFKNTRKML